MCSLQEVVLSWRIWLRHFLCYEVLYRPILPYQNSFHIDHFYMTERAGCGLAESMFELFPRSNAGPTSIGGREQWPAGWTRSLIASDSIVTS